MLGVFVQYGMQNPPEHSVTGTKAREKEFGIQVDVTGRGATYERDELGRTINLVEAGGVGRIARPAPGPPISGRGGGYVNWFGDSKDTWGRGATYERDAFGRTINLVEAGGVGGIARRAPGPPISGRGGGYGNSFGNIKRLGAEEGEFSFDMACKIPRNIA